MGLKKFLEDIELYFELGGKYEKWYVFYEVVVIIFYMFGYVNKGKIYVCDNIDLKCMMILVWMVMFFVMFFGMFNIGYQVVGVLV